MKNYFTISELCISDNPLPLHVADKLLQYHIIPMNVVRDKIGMPIYASQNSGYRPYEWEIKRGRSGKSQHTFKGKGAVDWTADNLKLLFVKIFQYTNYTRIAVYPDGEGSFLHCDHAASERQLFLSNSSSNWKTASYEEIISKL